MSLAFGKASKDGYVENVEFDEILDKFDPCLRDVAVITLKISFNFFCLPNDMKSDFNQYNHRGFDLQGFWFECAFYENQCFFKWVEWWLNSKVSGLVNVMSSVLLEK